jgi:hypothetical protein
MPPLRSPDIIALTERTDQFVMDNCHAAAAEAVDGGSDESSERSFRSNLREMQHKIVLLTQENFELKLNNSQLRDNLLALEKTTKSSMRRATEDTFYDFDYEDNNMGGDESSRNAQRHKEFADMKAEYQKDVAKLQGEKEAAIDRLAEVEQRAATSICEKEMALDNALSENMSLRVQLEIADEGVASSIALAVSQVEDKLGEEITQLHRNLEAERSDKITISERLRTLEDDLIAAREKTEPSALAKSIIAEQAAAIRKLENLLESELSTRVLERQASVRRYDDVPSGLSEPGFELYKRLVSGMDGSVLMRTSQTKAWRETVLNELNDSLLKLYTMARQLEQDRAAFVDKHCRSLIARRQSGRSLEGTSHAGEAH